MSEKRGGDLGVVLHMLCAWCLRELQAPKQTERIAGQPLKRRIMAAFACVKMQLLIC